MRVPPSTPSPNEQRRTHSQLTWVTQFRVFPKAVWSLPCSCQAGLADTVPPHSPSEGKSGHWLPALYHPETPGPEGLGCPGVVNPADKHMPAVTPQAASSLAAKLSKSRTQFGGVHASGAQQRPTRSPYPGLRQGKTARMDPHQEEIWGKVTQPGAPVGTHRKRPPGALQTL